MYYQKVFKAGSAMRVTIPRDVARALDATIRTSLVMEILGPGRVLLRNADALLKQRSEVQP